MKRGDLMRRLAKIAKAEGVELEIIEGGSHTKVWIAERQTVVARHNEISEHTARSIIRHMEAKEGDE